jgi:CRISPR system Cascade subunit CasD
MAAVVVFRLEAALAAFGDLAVGENWLTHRRPGASMALGLVAAALGIPRDAPDHARLAADWKLAVREDRAGAPLADYHTAQAPPQRRGRRFATRREELADANDLATVISRRDYVTDAAFTIALWPMADAELDPQRIADALRRPVWTPYAGRRSCPLAARVIDAETLIEAFQTFDASEHAARAAHPDLPTFYTGDVYAYDEAFGPGGPLEVAAAGLAPRMRERRRDMPLDRQRWQFGLRTEIVGGRVAP